jgi:hypothetical protein
MLNAMPMAQLNRATRNNAVNALVPLARGRQRTASTMLIISFRSRQRHLSVDGAPVKSNIWKSRHQLNVQLRMLYLTNETGPLKLFKRPSYLSLNATFSSFSIPPPHLEPEIEMTQVEFFFRFGFPNCWMDGAYFGPNPKLLSSKLWT